MIESKTIRTKTEPIAKLAHWQNGQTAKRLAATTDKRTIGCMSRHTTIQATGELTVQQTGCVALQLTVLSDKQPVVCAGSQINGQLTALAAISIIN
ncbi:hypothetical protein FACS1894123_06770 [Bacteroidia bacterium]|nr:hypothetical protein FACS1894123_06770 [Bacteroidia bacterium]